MCFVYKPLTALSECPFLSVCLSVCPFCYLCVLFFLAFFLIVSYYVVCVSFFWVCMFVYVSFIFMAVCLCVCASNVFLLVYMFVQFPSYSYNHSLHLLRVLIRLSGCLSLCSWICLAAFLDLSSVNLDERLYIQLLWFKSVNGDCTGIFYGVYLWLLIVESSSVL